MAYIPTIRILSDPLKHARLYFVLEPFLDKIDFGKYKPKKMQSMLETTKEWSQNNHIVAPLTIFRKYNQNIRENLDKLKDKKIIFIPGSSIDKTITEGEYTPNMISRDCFSERFRLTDEIIKINYRLKEKYNVDSDAHFAQIATIFLPFFVNENFEAQHSLEEVVELTNQEAETLGINARFGTTRKSLEGKFQPGTFQFSDALFDSHKAKYFFSKRLSRIIDRFRKGYELDRKDADDLTRLFGNVDELKKIDYEEVEKRINMLIEDSCHFNLCLAASAYSTIANTLDLDPITLFSRRSTYAYKIMEKAAKMSGRKLDNWGKDGIMPKKKVSVLGECEPYALEKLEGRLYRNFKQNKSKIFTPINISEHKPNVELATIPGLCPELGCFRCLHAEECGSGNRQEKCASDFVQNKFTKSDVKQVLDHHGLKIDADKYYEELRFKTKKVRVYNHKKRKYETKEINEFDLLKQDCFNEGYSITDVTLDRKILNSCHDDDLFLLKQGEYLSRSWIGFRKDMQLRPLPVISLLKKNPADYEFMRYVIRGSEFANKCHIGRIVSKIDKSKPPFCDIPENMYAAIGTTRHKIGNQRPWIDYTDKDSHHMIEYCEQTVLYDALGRNIKGHGDGFFTLSNDEERYLFNLDFKRAKKGAYEKPAYLMQLLLYSMGMEQMLGDNFDGYVFCLVKRFFHGEPGEDNFPEYSLFYVPKGGQDEITLEEYIIGDKGLKKERISGVREIIEPSYEIQRMILEDDKFFWRYTNKMIEAQNCNNTKTIPEFSECFNKPYCEIVKQFLRDGVRIQDYLMDDLDF